MARQADRPPSDSVGGLTNLQKRILSAAVLLPVVAVAIMLGHPYFTVLIALFAGAGAWECVRVAGHTRAGNVTTPVPNALEGAWLWLAAMSALAVAAVVLLTGFQSPWRLAAMAVVAVVWLICAVLSRAWRRIAWALPGVIYVGLAATALVLVRNSPEQGTAALFWIIALVVAADTGGYLVGRTIGGPKLAPRISPNKTWSGLGGAVAGAAMVGLLTAFELNHTNVFMLTLISAGLGLVEQAGDLAESAFKRHFGVKDTSQIIPGHGGVLDRVDGLLAVAVAVVIVNAWAGGSVLAW